jgi:invasion protein IalB
MRGFMRASLKVWGAITLIGAMVPVGDVAAAQEPRKTTATYYDWTITCVMQPETKQKSCNIVQSQTVQQSISPVQLVLERGDQDGSLRMLLSMPANVWLRTGVRLRVSDDDPGAVARFQWCIPQRCYAEGTVKQETVATLLSPDASARLEFKDASQKDVILPVSLKGFSEAMSALANE